jgi:integrase
MINVNYQYVRRIKKRLADGSIKYYHYHKYSGAKIEGEPGTVEFQLSYDKACKRRIENTNTFAIVIHDYFSSREFRDLSDRTRSDYLKHRNLIEEKWGSVPLEVLRDKKITKNFRRWRDDLAKKIGDRQADLVFATTRRLFSFGMGDGTLESNPLMCIQSVYRSDRSELIWLPEHISKFMLRADLGLQLAVVLALNLGRREGDLIRLSWDDFKGDVMMVTNRKSGKTSRFPAMATEALRTALETYRRSRPRVPHRDEPILATPTGLRWRDENFRSKFSKIKNEAGLHQLHFHDLRGTAITVLAEQGCTEQQIASISGHSLRHISAILDKYMARTRALNAEATRALEQSWVANIKLVDVGHDNGQ